MRWSVIAALLMCGCKEEEPALVAAVPDAPVPVDTVDTALDLPDEKLTAELRFFGLIAWDSNTRTVVDYSSDGSDLISAFILNLYEEDWVTTNPGYFCRVVIPLAGMTMSETAITEGFDFGIDIPEGPKKGAYTNCIDEGFTPSQFTDEDPLKDWSEYGFRLRMGGEPTKELIEWLTPKDATDFNPDTYLAGEFATIPGDYVPTDADANYWEGFPMSTDFVVDSETRLLKTEMVAGPGNVADALYVFDQRVFWNLLPE